MKFFKLSVRLLIALLICHNSISQDTIHWRPDYKLSWEDFQGRPDSNSEYKAISSPSINFSLSYNKSSFSYNVICSFNKSKSWTLSNSQNLLTHEQGHFDIAEIFARKLRQTFKNYKVNLVTIERDFKKMYDKTISERDSMNALYDKETDFSRNKPKQLYWNKKIIKELKKFQAFAL